MEKSSRSSIKPRLIIHGGAGNISRNNLSPKAWAKYRESLVRIYKSTDQLLQSGGSALDVVTHAVTLFEDDEQFNCGKGAVFTRDGTNELEASVMTTKGHIKRASAVVMLKHVKNPIKLAREMLLRGDVSHHTDLLGLSDDTPVGAQGHLCLGGETAEKLAKEWGLDIVDKDYFWTKKRWQQHRRGLNKDEKKKDGIIETAMGDWQDGDADGWDGIEYLPQGTTGCVALDSDGTIAVATSTGGLTNKLPFRIGDTPTIGAGFWAEQWDEAPLELLTSGSDSGTSLPLGILNGARALIGDCLPRFGGYSSVAQPMEYSHHEKVKSSQPHAIAVSGTGNGDSFLKLAASRTVGAIVRFSYPSIPARTLASAFNQIVGPGGKLQRSAGDRWEKTGEGEGGMIGIELKDGKGTICWDFNCGGMFRCWADVDAKIKVGVFREEEEIDV